MNRIQAAKLLPIIKAFSEGQEVEYFDNGSNKWRTCVTPQFDYDVEYRIKSEPTYRPFKDAEECWTEMLKHQPFGWVKLKDTESGYYMLKGIASQVGVIGFNEIPFSYKKVFKDYVFADGLPFGIKVEE